MSVLLITFIVKQLPCSSFSPKLSWTIHCYDSKHTSVPCLIALDSLVALAVKNLPASAGDVGDLGSIPGSGRSPAGGHGNPLQYSCLENPMEGEAWWATVHGVAKSCTQLRDLAQMHAPWISYDNSTSHQRHGDICMKYRHMRCFGSQSNQ